ncbi:hypothetical protein J5Y04_03845 [Kitasatospora sp. RG8]|uniref:hypothetical protein n=1 Tax=Kitasatospora sp. RG8 TaxID=2820815 RepID=UPI001ADF4B5B|nr:hypothetical protein [Kitasatospora sp. RG8]MBP0448676.1 hypothetical protein [Kitasatospora sp. RG8]
MNRKKRGLRLQAAAATFLLGLGGTAGCGTVHGGDTGAHASASEAVVSQADASAAVSGYDAANNRVNEAMDSAGLAGIETEPLLSADVAWMRISKELNQPVAPISDQAITVYATSGPAFPHWFLAVSSRAQGGMPFPGPTYRVFVQEAPGASYLPAYSLNVTGPVPKVAVDGAGVASAVPGPDGLLVAPDALAADILAHYQQNLAGKDKFSYSAPLDDNLSNGYNAGVKALSGRGTTLSRALGRTLPKTFALRTEDGGVLAFTSDVITDTLTPVKADGTVSLAPKSRDAAQLGKPEGATASQFTISRLETFLTYIPTTASGAKAQVIGYNEVPITVS